MVPMVPNHTTTGPLYYGPWYLTTLLPALSSPPVPGIDKSPHDEL